MRQIRALTAGIAMMLVGATDAPWIGEFVLPAANPEFVLGSIGSHGEMREFVPHGENIDHWTRLITISRGGYRVGLTPDIWLARWLTLMTRVCPGSTTGPIASAPLGDHAGAKVTFTCPTNPRTGLPESVTARVVLGDQGIQMIQAAARRTFTIEDRRWADAVVTTIILCEPTPDVPRCANARNSPVGSSL